MDRGPCPARAVCARHCLRRVAGNYGCAAILASAMAALFLCGRGMTRIVVAPSALLYHIPGCDRRQSAIPSEC